MPARKRTATPPPPAAAPALAATPRPLVHVLLLALLTAPWWLAVSLPFIHIDDPGYVWQNPHLQHGLTPDSIRWAFTTTFAAFYFPVTWLSLLLDVSLFGHGAAGMHFTNVVLHLANTFLLYAFLRRTTSSPWRSFLVAALFSIHPLRVESVAWVTERKDVLFTFFGLLSLFACLAYTRAPSAARRAFWYGALCLFYALSLLSKPMLVTLPFLLLLLDLWPLRRLTASSWRGPVLEKLPLLLLPLAHGLLTLSIQQKSGAIGNFPLAYRLGNAALSYFFYLRDTVYFQGYSIFYPPYQPLPWPLVLLGVLLLAALTVAALVIFRRGLPGESPDDRPRRPAALVGWLWFVGTLVPVIGLIPSGMQSRADRFTYWPAIGLFIALVYPWPAAWFTDAKRRQLATLAAAAALLVLAFNTTVRLMAWRDPLRLYIDSVAVNPRNDWLKSNIGSVYFNAGDFEEAEKWYRSSLADNNGNHDAHVNYARLLALQGRWAQARTHYAEALRLRPDNAEARAGMEAAATREFSPTVPQGSR